MTLPGKKFEEIQEFLRCIYPSVMEAVTIKNAYQVVALAEEYQVVTLKSKCEACFLSSIDENSSAETLCRLIDIACLYSLDDLFHKCTTLAASKSVSELNETEEKATISQKGKNVIHREIINKMESTQVETNQMVDDLNKELQRVLVLYSYHRMGILKNERLSFDDFKDWNGSTVFLKIDTSKYRPLFNLGEHKCVVDIRGTHINLEFKFTDGYFRLYISVPETEIQQSKVKLIGKVVVLNGLKGKEDFCKIIKMELKRNIKSSNVAILKEEIALGNEGLIFHGEMGVEVHLLVLNENVK